MLVLSRKPNESIVIDGRITVTLLRVENDTVRIGIDAPIEIPVFRKEVYDEIRANNRHAAGSAPVKPGALPKVRPVTTTVLPAVL